MFPTQLSDWRDNGNDQPLASVYVKFFGQEVAFANLDKAIIEQVIEVNSLLSHG